MKNANTKPRPRYEVLDLFDCEREGGQIIKRANSLPVVWAFCRRYMAAVEGAAILRVIDTKTGREVAENALA